jgi:hypothetical protein
MSADPLSTSMLDLWHAMGDAADRVLLGGGYGLYLKQQQMSESGVDTLIPAELWPEPRTTQDLDLLLTAEVVGDAASMQLVRDALDALGFTVIPDREYLQFERRIGPAQVIKVDLLTAQLGELNADPGIRADSRRARPKSIKGGKLHAHPTDGAIGLSTASQPIRINGKRSDGVEAQITVRLPHPFSYLLMKLTAYRDRKNDAEKDLGRHHALDIYRIVAMLTEPELVEVHELLKVNSGDEQVESCREVVLRDFLDEDPDGVRAMRQHALWREPDQLAPFFDVLRDLFAA